MSRILIIEDELPMRTALTDLMQAQGYRVITAADGEVGLERALTEKPDLLLLDVMMPRMDGYSVCREIRRVAPALPILMLTARGQVEHRVTGLDAGADDYLVKPFSSRELLARVRALLRRTDRKATVVERIAFGDVEIDFSKQICVRAGKRSRSYRRKEIRHAETARRTTGRAGPLANVFSRSGVTTLSDDPHRRQSDPPACARNSNPSRRALSHHRSRN